MIYRSSIGVLAWARRALNALAYGWGRNVEGSGQATVASGLSAGDRFVSDFFKAH
jgi:hypothetical protein